MCSKQTYRTLLPIIQRVCLLGAIIYSNQLTSYLRLAQVGFDLFSVNQSDPEHRFIVSNGTNTLVIKIYCNRKKYLVKAMKSIRRNMILGYFAESMWMNRYLVAECFSSLLTLIKL